MPEDTPAVKCGFGSSFVCRGASVPERSGRPCPRAYPGDNIPVITAQG